MPVKEDCGMKVSVEVCAGSVEDCIKAEQVGANTIELNNGLFLGGLTPSYATLKLAKQKTSIPIISMVRPRAGGFHYNDVEIETMFMDAEHLLENGSNGLAFGFLTNEGLVDKDLTLKMTQLCHRHHASAVFHRAFDIVEDPIITIEALIECGVDRILTSGLKATAPEGAGLLRQLQINYGDRIELLMGSGINSNNVAQLIQDTGIKRVHASFKGWFDDATTQSESVSYAYSNEGDYDGVDPDKLGTLMAVVTKL